MTPIRAKPLTTEAFAPFGRVTERLPSAGSLIITEASEATAQAQVPVLQLVRIEALAQPLSVTQLESHPFSAQTFLPLDMSPSIAVVCLRDADGKPDLSTLEAFIVKPDQIVTYKCNTLHHKLTPLRAPASFAMSMRQTGSGADTILHDLSVAVQIEWSYT